MTRRALVLGAGGYAAEAWQVGILTGLADAHVSIEADVLIGTSAGARVAAALATGKPLTDLAAAQRRPDEGLERADPEDAKRWRASFAEALAAGGRRSEVLERLGKLGAGVATKREPRRSLLASMLASLEWPTPVLRAVAVNADDGERVVLDAASGCPLLDAIEASGAMPGLFPLVPVDGHLCMDGGTYSIDNADVAADCDIALVLTLRAKGPICVASLDEGVAALRARGTRYEVIEPDEHAEAAFAAVHGNVLDPSVRKGALDAGRAQARAITARIGSLWSGAPANRADDEKGQTDLRSARG